MSRLMRVISSIGLLWGIFLAGVSAMGAPSVAFKTVSPSSATANSIWIVTVTAKGVDGFWLLEKDFGYSTYIDLKDGHYYSSDSDGNYTFFVTAGLGMCNVASGSKSFHGYWIYYLGGLWGTGGAPGFPDPHTDTLGYVIDPVNDKPVWGPKVTIHDSHYYDYGDVPGVTNVLFGGGYRIWGDHIQDRDFLTSMINHETETYYEDAAKIVANNDKHMPTLLPNPCRTGTEYQNPEFQENPDDGTSATMWKFSVMYTNDDGLPPVPYHKLNAGDMYINTDLLRSDAGCQYGGLFPALGGHTSFPFGLQKYDYTTNSGVVLYIGTQGGAYYAVPMYPDPQYADTGWTDVTKGVIYTYELKPEDWNHYCSLPVGRYSYFFGCSDDTLRTTDGEEGIHWWYEPWPYQPGDTGYCYFDPYHSIGDLAKSWGNCLSSSILVDRPTYQPGCAPSAAPFGEPVLQPADQHPVVTVGLYGVPGSNLWTNGTPLTRWETYYKQMYTEVLPRTVEPYKRCAWPSLSGSDISVAGATVSTPLVFKVLYQQLDGKFPEDQGGGKIVLCVDGTEYPLHRVADDNLGLGTTDASVGCLYKSNPITLSPGGHSYYFLANDGTHPCRFPGRTSFCGPYINHKPTLETGQVLPMTGVAGQNFHFTVKYKDADNQRPRQAHMIVTYADGQRETVNMLPQSTSTDYVSGVTYYFDSANLAHQLQPGTGSFSFDFVDDWGSLTDAKDQVWGEEVTTPEYPGPVVIQNSSPVLNNGSVTHVGTSTNEATVWTYKVTYTSADNAKPTYVGMYMGYRTAHNVNGTKTIDENDPIVWDNGHAMARSNSNTSVDYTQGVEYSYSTTLVADREYYYAFVASDGVNKALYNNSISINADEVWGTVDSRYSYSRYGEKVLPSDAASDGAAGVSFCSSHDKLVGPIAADSTQINPLYTHPIVTIIDPVSGPQVLAEGTDYTIDYTTGRIATVKAYTEIYLQYVFGEKWKNETIIGTSPNPVLSSGTESPTVGTSNDKYTFSVTYSQADGQGPTYVRAVVDNTNLVTLSPITASQNFANGAGYQAKVSLTPGPHSYYFETQCGPGYAMYDSTRTSQSSHGYNSNTVVPKPFIGPYVVDVPMLTIPTAIPNPAATENPDHITSGQPVSYSVLYTEDYNYAPNDGYPILYIDQPLGTSTTSEIDYPGVVTDVAGTVLHDSSKHWASSVLKGWPLQITSGARSGKVYLIADNTANTVTVATGNLTDDAIAPNTTYNIGGVVMNKADAYATDFTKGITYQCSLPCLGVANGVSQTHSFHMKAITNQNVGAASPRVAISRSVEVTGPKVNPDDAPTTVIPVLSSGICNPAVGSLTSSYKFTVNYRDDAGYGPVSQNQSITGYMRVVIDGVKYDMTCNDANPTFLSPGNVYSYTLSRFDTPGDHKYHFEASDGWHVVGTQDQIVHVNYPPVLTDISVNPTSGTNKVQYAYSVKYTDPDFISDSVTPANVQLYIDTDPSDANALAVSPGKYTKSVDSGSLSTGRVYTFTLNSDNGADYFTSGDMTHTAYFRASDNIDWSKSSVLQGPRIHGPSSPELQDDAKPVTSTSSPSYDTDTFTFNVWYRDIAAGEPPAWVYVDIDGGDTAHGGSGTGTTLKMSQATTGVADYTSWVKYTVSLKDSTVMMGAEKGKNHSFRFRVSDGTNPLPDETVQVFTRKSPKIDVTVPSSVVMGQETKAIVTMADGDLATATVTFTDKSQAGHRVTAVNVGDQLTASYIPNVDGTLTVQASCPLSGAFTAGTSAVKTMRVLSPSTQVNGLAMISVPVSPNPSYASGVFDASTADFIVGKWVAANNAYKRYSCKPNDQSDVDFPAITSGQGYWIRTTEPKTIAPSGQLVPLDSNYEVALSVGYNQIGDPFNVAVDWSKVFLKYGGSTKPITTEKLNWIQTTAIGYDTTTHGYFAVGTAPDSKVKSIEPWQGYWVYAYKACSLIIPGPKSTGITQSSMMKSAIASSKAKTKGASASGQYMWLVNLKATNGSLSDDMCRFGVGTEKESLLKPSLVEEYVQVCLTDDKGRGSNAEDVRVSADDNCKWSFVVSTDTAGDVKLTWEGLEETGGVALNLVDSTTGKTVEMTPGGSYTFHADQDGAKRLFHVTLKNASGNTTEGER